MRPVPLALSAAGIALAAGLALVAFAEDPETPPPPPEAPVVCDTFSVDSTFGAVSKTALESHRLEVEEWLTERAREGYIVPLHTAVFPPTDGRNFGGLLCLGRTTPPA